MFLGLSIYEGFGQTETTLLAGVVPGMKLRPGSMGKPAPGYDLKVTIAIIGISNVASPWSSRSAMTPVSIINIITTINIIIN